MKLLADARAFAQAGKPAEAVSMVEREAERGNAEAHLILANWRLFGANGPRDAKKAHWHLAKAAAKGSADALRMRAYLTAGGTGCDADPAAAARMLGQLAPSDPAVQAQLSLLPHMMSASDASKLERERLSADPHIEIVRGALLPEERAHVMRIAGPLLKRSLVDDPVTGKGRPDPIRTSHGTSFAPHAEDLVLQALGARVPLLTGTDPRQGEAFHVMRYTPGQEYKPHLAALAALENQRAMSAISYLSDGYEGGETVFPKLSIGVRAAAGDLLIFRNVDAAGRPDPRLLHAGRPVTQGEKWIATRWIRERAHDPYARG